MCGRFTLAASAETINEHFQIPGELQVTPRYNIAPNQMILAIWQLAHKSCEFFFTLRFNPALDKRRKFTRCRLDQCKDRICR